MTTLSNETEARLRAEVERNTAPFRAPDIAGLCKKLRFSETCISALAAEVDRLTDTIERQAAEIERLRDALWPFANAKPTGANGFVNICALNVDVIAARAALTGEDT